MNRRFGIVAAVCACAALLATVAASADDDKQLQNVKGSVSYQAPSNKTPVPVGEKATVGVADQSYAITGSSSLGALILPDSSQVMVGSDSKVQVAFFNQTQIANAKFVIYDGKVRFEVRHPKGAQANYTFTTPTGSVAVRGTQGDISYDEQGHMLVNVYELCDPNKPVIVTLKGGKIFNVVAGQSLAAQIVGGIVQAQLQQLTQQLIDRFTGDFGVPTSWDQAKGQVIAYAQNQAAGAINNAAPGYGGAIAQGVGGLFSHKSKATPSPAPTPATCH